MLCNVKGSRGAVVENVDSSDKKILKDAEVCRVHSGVFLHFNVGGGGCQILDPPRVPNALGMPLAGRVCERKCGPSLAGEGVHSWWTESAGGERVLTCS